MSTKTEVERTDFLSGLGLNPNAPALIGALIEPSKKAATTTSINGPRIAPEGVDPRTMPVSDIVFDPMLLDGFTSLRGEHMNAASAHIFAIYKSYGRNKDRNGLLHRKISEFIAQVRTERESGGFVKERIKTTKEQREIANLLASEGMTVADLITLLKDRKGDDAR